jgi:LacI family transcriptional regulator
VSLRDVAERADVSTATVSRVFSDATHPVRESTRQAVLEAAAELGFEPNRLARSLVTSRSQAIGVIVHDISDSYFGDIVRGLEDELSRADYRLLIASTDRDAEKEVSYLRALMAQQVDGIVLAASSIEIGDYREAVTATVERYRRRGGVVVRLSDHLVDVPHVRFDNRGAACRWSSTCSRSATAGCAPHRRRAPRHQQAAPRGLPGRDAGRGPFRGRRARGRRRVHVGGRAAGG